MSEHNPEEVGESLCDCYQTYVAKKGLDYGIWYCDSITMIQSRFFRIYRERNFGTEMTDYSWATVDSANSLISEVHLYIGNNCEGYFYKSSR